jgi:hypothetical protein
MRYGVRSQFMREARRLFLPMLCQRNVAAACIAAAACRGFPMADQRGNGGAKLGHGSGGIVSLRAE